MTVLSAILPVILVIATGFAARATGLVPHEAWPGIERLAYRLLFPAVLILSIAQADLSAGRVGLFGAALLAVLAIAATLLLGLRRVLPAARLPNPAFTSIFQAVTRWNGFIALAIIALLSGDQGMGLISAGMAFMIPTINVANILVLAAFGPESRSLRRVLTDVLHNPLVQACAIGIALNLSDLPLPGPILGGLEMIGQAGLAIGIMAVGAAIQPRRLLGRSAALWAGVGLRLAGMPALFLILGRLIGLEPDTMVAGVLAMAVPAAANGYIVAREMGGDAGLYADILTWQTVLSALTIPLWLWIAMMP